MMTENTANLKASDAIKRKSVGIHTKKDLSELLSSDSDSTTKSEYESKRLNKKKIYQKRDPIKLYAKLTAKLLTTEYKSKIIKLK